MSLWKEVGAGGGWSYGYGEYMKTVAQLAAVEQKYRKVVNNLPSWLQNAAAMAEQLGEQALAQYVGNLTQYTQIPTYYLWIKGPGYKGVGGEWNLFTGGAAAMKSYFSSVFAPAVKSTMLTMATADAICFASRSAPGAWNPASDPQRLRTEALRAKGGNSSAAPDAPGTPGGTGGAGGGFMLPLVIGAGLILLLALRR